MANTLSISDRPSASLTSQIYHPKPIDVLNAKSIITKKLPLEIVDLIIDLAEYWPHSCVTLVAEDPTLPIRILGGSKYENTFLLRSYPIGYIPGACDPENASSLNESYLTTSPSPDLTFPEASQELSNEIISHWTQDSQIRGEFPGRKVIFTLKSHDQGWGGDARDKGTYNGSFTWFDVGKEKFCFCETEAQNNDQASSTNPYGQSLITLPHFIVAHPRCTTSAETPKKTSVLCTSRTIVPKTVVEEDNISSSPDNTSQSFKKFDHPLLSDTSVLQKNATADQNTKVYSIVWSWDDDINPESTAAKELAQQGRGPATANGEFVRNLRFGDIVTIWGKSRFPGWANHVFEVKIDVYWAI